MSSGGGAKTSTTTSGISEKFEPYLEKSLGIATNRLTNQFDEQGNLRDPSAEGIVAGLANQQKRGLSGQEALAEQAMSGTGVYNDQAAVQRMLQNASGAQDFQMQGALGSARADRAKQSALADMAYDFQTARQQKAEGGAQSLQDVGGAYQEQKQKILDAPYTELQRYSNVAFGNAPQTSTTQQTGGGK